MAEDEALSAVVDALAAPELVLDETLLATLLVVLVTVSLAALKVAEDELATLAA